MAGGGQPAAPQPATPRRSGGTPRIDQGATPPRLLAPRVRALAHLSRALRAGRRLRPQWVCRILRWPNQDYWSGQGPTARNRSGSRGNRSGSGCGLLLGIVIIAVAVLGLVGNVATSGSAYAPPDNAQVVPATAEPTAEPLAPAQFPAADPWSPSGHFASR